MAIYRYGHRLIESTRPLRELKVAPGPGPAIELEFAPDKPQADARPVDRWLHHWPDGYGGNSFSLTSLASRYLLRFPGLADFVLDIRANAILVEPIAGIEPDTLEHLLIDQVLPRFLAQQGDLLVHACAVMVEGRVLLFLGDSGWGKSTLAGHLHDAGYVLLSDDCVVLRVGGSTVMAVPTYPSLRLFSDSLARLYPDPGGSSAVAQYTEKRRVALPAFDSPVEGLPATSIYFLNSPDASVDACSIRRLRPMQCCLEAMKHAFKLDVTARDQAARILAQCATVAGMLPAFSLAYPRELDRMHELLDYLRSHVRALPAPR